MQDAVAEYLLDYKRSLAQCNADKEAVARIVRQLQQP